MLKWNRRMILGVLASTWAARGDNSSISIPGKRPMILHNNYPEDLEMPVEYFGSWQTPYDSFFVRQHIPRPKVDGASFRLTLDGRVNKPLSLSLGELRKLPQHELPATLECAGNGRGFYRPRVPGVQWMRGAIGNAIWRGPRVIDVLKHADIGVANTPDFIRSMPMRKMAHPATILALEMNGEPIPHLHGFPCRLIVPGWDGASWVKWVERMTVKEKPNTGFFMMPAYRFPKYNVAPGTGAKPEDLVMIEGMQVKSIIGSPADKANVPLAGVVLSGVAWAGEEAVERVEVSTDGGSRWRDAELSPQKLPFTWRLWKLSWSPPKPGYYTICSRATDTSGKVQPIVPPWNPSGYLWNAIDKIGVLVEQG
jgi:sulfite oxidase